MESVPAFLTTPRNQSQTNFSITPHLNSTRPLLMYYYSEVNWISWAKTSQIIAFQILACSQQWNHQSDRSNSNLTAHGGFTIRNLGSIWQIGGHSRSQLEVGWTDYNDRLMGKGQPQTETKMPAPNRTVPAFKHSKNTVVERQMLALPLQSLSPSLLLRLFFFLNFSIFFQDGVAGFST